MQARLEKLWQRNRFGIVMGLEWMEHLAECMGHPERAFAVIHVTGTNGKGSVCALLDSMLRAAGYRVGLYTSPHLRRFNERIKVNGEPVGDDTLEELVAAIDPLADRVTAETRRDGTFFEYTTALAFEYFRRMHVQVAVVEVGLGGRLDATNIVTPRVAVITSVDLEHLQYLGPDLPSVAREKAGIIKRGCPVVTGVLKDEAMAVVQQVATLQGAPLLHAEEVVTVRLLNESLQGSKVSIETATGVTGRCLLPLLGRHQIHNLAVAVTVMHVLTEINAVDAEPAVWFKGIEAVSWPGRLQRLRDNPPVILDGAHNPHAAEVLADFIRRLLKPRPVGLIFGMCADKDVDGFLGRVAPLLDRLWVVPVPDERNMPLKRVMTAARMAGLNGKTVTAELAPAYGEAVAWAESAGGAVCIAGSLFLAGAVLAMVDHDK